MINVFIKIMTSNEFKSNEDNRLLEK